MASEVDNYLSAVQCGVLIGPLRYDISTDELAKCCSQLLNSVGIRNKDISRICINNQIGYAKVELATKECEDYAMKILKDVGSVMSRYDLKQLTSKPKYLQVERIVSPDSHMQKLRGYSKIMVDNEHNNLSSKTLADPTAGDAMSLEIHPQEGNMSWNSKDPDRSTTGSSSARSASPAFGNLLDEDASRSQGGRSDAATSTSKKQQSAIDTSNDVAKPGMINARTSTPSMELCFHKGRDFYHHLHFIERNNEAVYFGDVDEILNRRSMFRHKIGQLVCAFLNSNPGTIYYGVNFDGQVVGLKVDQKNEDALRLDIDQMINTIRPSVLTSKYLVNFANVMGSKGSLMPDMKVLEVKITSPPSADTHYFFKNVPYTYRNNRLEEDRSRRGRY